MKQFTFRGKTIEELSKLNTTDFLNLLPARKRRSLKRGYTEAQKRLLLKIKKTKEGKNKKAIKTHCRNLIVTPEMIGLDIHIHDGKSFIKINIIEEMIGKYLGEFILTRKRITHSAPGVGATRSSAAVQKK